MGPVFRNEVDHQGKAYQDSWDPEGVGVGSVVTRSCKKLGRLVQEARITCHILSLTESLSRTGKFLWVTKISSAFPFLDVQTILGSS